ncbi:HD domain-containing protein [Anaerolineales bacterium HSG6]|nr:HD domain-containing protein [Anaerolineales bacterium HSG6]
MQTKAPNPVNLVEGQNTLPIIKAYFEFNQLKQLYRQGWLRRNVSLERCETVAEHSFSMAILAMLLADAYFPNLDLLTVIRMALVHDFGEVYAGDFTPLDPITPAEKTRLERESVVQVLGNLPQGEMYIALWDEFETGDSVEAQFVRQIDKLEFVMQATVYQQQGLIDANEMFEQVQQTLTLPELQEIFVGLTKV